VNGGEGSASDEPQSAEGFAESVAGGEGSASDEPQASRGGNEVDDEGAN
jgi:hypothetical protein